jgi:formate dehydrogenase major subunit
MSSKVLTVCPYCGTGCTFYLKVENNRLTGVIPNEDERSVNQGKLCAKGHYGYDFVHHRDRLTTPLIRRGGKKGQLQPASWDEALDLVASTLKNTAAEHGPEALAAFSSARCTNEENYLLQKIMRAGFGANNVDHCARL